MEVSVKEEGNVMTTLHEVSDFIYFFTVPVFLVSSLDIFRNILQ